MHIKKAIRQLKKSRKITHDSWSKDIYLEMVFVQKVYHKDGSTSHNQLSEEDLINYFEHYHSKDYLHNKWEYWEQPVDQEELIKKKLDELESQKELLESEIDKYKSKLK